MEKKASDTQRSVKMDVKAVKAELRSLHDHNVTRIKDLGIKINSLSGQATVIWLGSLRLLFFVLLAKCPIIDSTHPALSTTLLVRCV